MAKSDNTNVFSFAVSGENVYAAGWTDSSSFPGTTGGAQPAHGGGFEDGFVSLLSGDLKNLIQSTYLGGSGKDTIYSLAVSAGNVYAAGNTGSSPFPGTWEVPSRPMVGGPGVMALCLFFRGDLKALIQSTYLGGSSDDTAQSMAVSGGNVYAAGYTFLTNFPGTAEGTQPTHGGGFYDGFVARLSIDLKAV